MLKGSRDLVCWKETDCWNVNLCLLCLGPLWRSFQWYRLSNIGKVKQQCCTWGLGHPLSLGEQRWGTLENHAAPLHPCLPQASVVHPDRKVACFGVIKLGCIIVELGLQTQHDPAVQNTLCFSFNVFSVKIAMGRRKCWCKLVVMLLDTSLAAVVPEQKSRSQ